MNMSYCRWRNTNLNIQDCMDNLESIESKEEFAAMQDLLFKLDDFLKDNHVQNIMEMSFKDYKENIYENKEGY